MAKRCEDFEIDNPQADEHLSFGKDRADCGDTKGVFMAGPAFLSWRKSAFLCVPLLLMFLALDARGFAQTKADGLCNVSRTAEARSITGAITDTSGAMITSARVEAECDDLQRQTQSGADGSYRLKLNPGQYHLRVSAPGFTPVSQDLVIPSDGNVSALNFTLKVGQAGSTVTVTADSGYIASDASTGTKTDLPLLETPQSISTITREQMDDQGVTGLSSLLLYTAGVAAQTQGYEPSRDWSISLRGFDATSFGLFHNGLFWDSYAQTDSFELERVEILKGPSSVLYGENTPGGLINMVTKKPVTSLLRRSELDYGSYDRVQLTGDFGDALDRDGHWSYRAPVLYRHSGTQIDHIPDNRFLVAPSLRWSPNSATSLTLLMDYQYDHTGWIQFMPGYGTLFPNPNGQIPTSLDLGQPGWDKTIRRQASAGYEFTQLFGSHWSFHQNLRELLTKSDTRFTYYGDGSTNGSGFIDAAMTTILRYPWEYYPRNNTFAVDNQAEGKFGGGRLQQTILAGADVLRYNSSITYTGSDTSIPLNLFHPVYGPVVLPSDYSKERENVHQTGVYLQDQLKFDTHWVLLLSGRNDWVNSITDFDSSQPATVQPDHHLSGRAGLLCVSSSGFAPYFSYSQSFVPNVGTNFYGQPYKPTTAGQYEAGIKYQPRNARYLVTLSAFNISETNVQTPDPANPLNTIQTGAERSRGIELEVKANPLQGLNLTASYTYDPVKITSTTIPDQLGTSPVATPRSMGSVWGDYVLHTRTARGLGFGGGVRTTSSTYGGLGDSLHPSITVPSYTLFDGALHYDLERWRVAVNGANLADKRYVPSCSGIDNCYYGYRRTVNGSLRFTW
ncbi:TonB-dependent siderophore receptor [Granulicella mallensis]|uniref:Iron complex outermembrane receptor protein n=1 Tax=Granulicella mallensis TaxID=940614 RepID=A0A7W8EBH1_9BACT|nr:TonB-dependent siderophore receptor [Granulicella mallensis]MBB5065822.1 iron complex outermembrane receptor protein [Granulicella mallensis]